MNFKNIWVLLFVVTLLSFQSLRAQTAGTGALTGTIKDPSGAVVPNATVTATSLDTGAVRTDMTGADGSYRFSLLPPGNYRVRMEASGFKPLEIPSVAVAVTETAVLDRNLEVGAQTQTVTVEGEVEAIQTTSSALGTVADARTVTELPLNTRNYTNLLAMSTGVAANVSNATTIGKGATNMAVNGGSTGQNTYLMDGVVVNNWTALGGVTEGTLPGTFAMPNPDAISEFKIQTSSYDAGYGRNPGANVNVITKSGTNSFHGTAFEFFRNTALNANDWFLAGEGAPKAVLNSNVYGGSVGGPVKKDKLFFFVNYQESDQTNGYASYSQSADLAASDSHRRSRHMRTGGLYVHRLVRRGWGSFCESLGDEHEPIRTKTKGSTAVIQNPNACPAGRLRCHGPVQHQSHRHQYSSTQAAQRQLFRSGFGRFFELPLRHWVLQPPFRESRLVQRPPGHRERRLRDQQQEHVFRPLRLRSRSHQCQFPGGECAGAGQCRAGQHGFDRERRIRTWWRS